MSTNTTTTDTIMALRSRLSIATKKFILRNTARPRIEMTTDLAETRADTDTIGMVNTAHNKRAKWQRAMGI